MNLVIQDDAQKVRTADPASYKSLPFMTKYEFDQVIGLRTIHLARGALPFVEVKKQIEKNMNMRAIALEELKAGKLPYIIKRPMPNGKTEYWKVSNLDLIAVRHLLRP